MRPIIFRGKTLSGEWVYGNLITGNLGTRIREEIETNPTPENPGGNIEVLFHDVDANTVGQFTGLYDATKWENLTEQEREGLVEKEWKGRPIYEGDILSFATRKEWGYQKDGKIAYMLVVFGDTNVADCEIDDYLGFWAEYGCGQRDSIRWHVKDHQAKVVGNIYDNKELMYK